MPTDLSPTSIDVSAGRVTSQNIPTAFLSVALLLVCPGCTDETTSSPMMIPSSAIRSARTETEIREVSGDELRELVATSERPVLVEFSVLSGCFRCDDMRSPIREKAAEIQQHADVVRIDFNLNQGLARETGATVCPSYVVFSQGRVASVRTWPTSADFVADDVAAAVGQVDDDSVDVR